VAVKPTPRGFSRLKTGETAIKKIARKTRPTEVTRPQLRTTLGKLAREEADRQLTLTLGLRNLVRENLREFVISAGPRR